MDYLSEFKFADLIYTDLYIGSFMPYITMGEITKFYSKQNGSIKNVFFFLFYHSLLVCFIQSWETETKQFNA